MDYDKNVNKEDISMKNNKLIIASKIITNIMLFLVGLGIVMMIALLLLPKDYILDLLQQNNITNYPKSLFSPLSILASIIKTAGFGGVLWFVKKFLVNLSKDIIFNRINVTIIKIISILFVLSSLIIVSGTGIKLNVDLTYVLVGFIFMIFSLILDRAIDIAEENEFTV